MTDRGRILVVDDDEELRDTIREYFELCGFAVYAVADGENMRKVMAQSPVDVVLMDINLPGEDGLVLTRELRSSYNVGIVMLTGAGQTVDRIVGLEVGADDYVVKPFDPREVLARVKSVLRRMQKQPVVAAEAPLHLKPDIIRMGACTLDLAAHRLSNKEGVQVPLTAMEFDLLKTFALNPNRVLSRSQLLENAHQRGGEVFDRSIDLRIARVRRKIEADPKKPQVLKTVRGAGYVFVSGSRNT
jgi:two-component system, OmpR family, phosphate regulon response regulator OmpR